MGSDDSSSAGPEQDRGSGSVTNFATGAFQRMSQKPGYESDEEEDESPYRSTSSGSLVRLFIVKAIILIELEIFVKMRNMHLHVFTPGLPEFDKG